MNNWRGVGEGVQINDHDDDDDDGIDTLKILNSFYKNRLLKIL